MPLHKPAGPDLVEGEVTLPVEPRRGLDVLVPDDPQPYRAVRVLMRARRPVRPQAVNRLAAWARGDR